MGQNFHTSWVASVTQFKAAQMNPAIQYLDRGITYLKNVIVHCDGVVSWKKASNLLVWSGTLRILFNRDDGLAIQNTVVAATVSLADNQFAYVDLSETNNAVLTVTAASVTTGAASNFLAFNRLVLGYRNTTSDEYFPVALRLTDLSKVVQVLTPANSITVDWSLGSTAEVLLDRATTTFAFSGAHDGQRCVLVLLQDGTGGRAVAFGGEARAGTDLSLPPTLSALNKTDYLGFIYRDVGGFYDFVSLSKGF